MKKAPLAEPLAVAAGGGAHVFLEVLDEGILIEDEEGDAHPTGSLRDLCWEE